MRRCVARGRLESRADDATRARVDVCGAPGRPVADARRVRVESARASTSCGGSHMDAKTSFVDLNSNLGFLRARKQRDKSTREQHATNVNVDPTLGSVIPRCVAISDDATRARATTVGGRTSRSSPSTRHSPAALSRRRRGRRDARMATGQCEYDARYFSR